MMALPSFSTLHNSSERIIRDVLFHDAKKCTFLDWIQHVFFFIWQTFFKGRNLVNSVHIMECQIRLSEYIDVWHCFSDIYGQNLVVHHFKQQHRVVMIMIVQWHYTAFPIFTILQKELYVTFCNLMQKMQIVNKIIMMIIIL